MLTTSKIKLIHSLKLKKFRQKYNLFIAEGSKLLKSLLHQDRYRIREIYATSDIFENPQFSSVRDAVTVITSTEMKKVSMLNTPSEVICLLDIPEVDVHTAFSRALYLDGIQDPGNVGTIIRTADWFGVDVVFRSENTADFYGSKVVQATMGSFANVKLATTAIPDLPSYATDVQVIVADMAGQLPDRINFKEPLCLVLGAEGRGVSADAMDAAEHVVSIPGHPARLAESLNAASAAGILCYELFNRTLT